MSPDREEIVLTGIAASPGVAFGPACIVLQHDLEIPQRKVPPEERENEVARFEQGLLETRRQISAIRAEVAEKLGESEAEIFDAHQLVLEDRALIEEAVDEVANTGYNIEYAFHQVANRYIDAFTQIDDEYIKERVADIRDVTRRLLSNLLGHQEVVLSTAEASNVIIADDLSPTDTARLDRTKLKAIATDGGSRTSHSVIMARSLGVPCVVGLKTLSAQVEPGDTVLVDGFDGIVLINPNEASCYRYGQLQIRREKAERMFAAVRYEPALTRDGRELRVLLNVDGQELTDELKTSGAGGIGLFRTENLFLATHGYPDEEAQYQTYRRFIEAFAPHPVTIRTLDLGGDKNPHTALYGYAEANPFMGFRAIRFCLEHIDVFKAQLRAILRASAHGAVKVMYPMISNCEEVVAANRLLEECAAELRTEGHAMADYVPRGCMIEIPSAAVITDLLAEHCDFFSIGTNDLIQYMLAVDRVNDRISHLYDPGNPAILRALNFIFQAGHRKRRPVSVCGEMAGDPLYAPLLFGMGADELSVTRSAIPEIKYLIRHIDHSEARKLAGEVLRMPNSNLVRERLRQFYEQHVARPE
ncbi:MAG: phosphoenolpyruvate--protein phosphotransferase [Opitutales bacterium]